MIQKVNIVYLDSKNNICSGTLENLENAISITLQTNEGEIAGKAILSFKKRHAIAKYIYCNQKFRNRGIGTKLIDIMETCAARKSSVIIGVFEPFQEEDDKLVFGDDADIKINTRFFFKNHDYQVLSFSPTNIDLYMRYSTFILDGKDYKPIIFKSTNNITPKFEFFGDILFDKSIYDMKEPQELKQNIQKA